MEWTDEKVLNCIEEYKARPGLWDPSNPEYKHNTRKHDSWRSLADICDTDVSEVKKKINSLLASFRRERTKEKKRTGMGANEVYKSNWFAYNSMTFLLEKFKVKETRSSEDTIQNDDGEAINEDEPVLLTTQAEILEESNLTTQAEIDNNAITSDKDINRQRTFKPTGKPPKLRKLDAQFNQAFDVIKSVSQKIGANKSAPQTKSTDYVFGEYVASKLSGYSDYTKNFVQHKINNIMFDADMGFLDQSEDSLQLLTPTISIQQQCNSGSTSTYSSSAQSPRDGTLFTYLP